MSEPQYIITEEQLQQLHTRMKNDPLGEGHGSLNISMAWYETKNLIELIRTREYDPAAIQKAERERVLDQAIHILEKVRNTFDATGFLVVDHKLPVLYLDEAKAAIKCGIAELREQEEK